MPKQKDVASSGITSTQELDARELELIARFRTHPFFSRAQELNDASFLLVLIQRRFLSLAFIPVFQLALGCMTDRTALAVVRKIVREEYPRDSPSHAENLVAELIVLGATRTQIVVSQPTQKTIQVIRRSLRLLQRSLPEPAMQIRALAVIRFWGEVLVAEEYDCLTCRMAAMGLNSENSQFYWPHFQHDKRLASFAHGSNSKTHSDMLTVILRRLMDTPEKLRLCAEANSETFHVKRRFYDQFLPTAPGEIDRL